MPEGHTLHRLAHQITDLFVGQPWRVSSPQGRFASGATLLDGRVPDSAQAWGKHVFVHLGAEVWQVHLGLYGAFSFQGDEQFGGAATLGAPRIAAEAFTEEYDDDGWVRPLPPTGAVRARIRNAHGWADLRGPATCAVLSEPEYSSVISRLGPDPLRAAGAGTAAEQQGLRDFAERLSKRRISIAAALMDQSVIAGVGNIYRAETLFIEGINPRTPAKELGDDQIARLWHRVTAALQDGVNEGIIVTLRQQQNSGALDEADQDSSRVHDYRAGSASAAGLTARRHWVYQHQNTPCLRCKTPIMMDELQGRRLYWCPGCQR